LASGFISFATTYFGSDDLASSASSRIQPGLVSIEIDKASRVSDKQSYPW